MKQEALWFSVVGAAYSSMLRVSREAIWGVGRVVKGEKGKIVKTAAG